MLDAPQPSPCDKVGEPLDCVVVNGKATTPGAGGGSPSPGASGSPSPGTGAAPSSAPSPGASGPIAVTGQVVNVGASSPNKLMLSVLTAVAVILAVIVPPTLGGWLRRRRRQESG